MKQFFKFTFASILGTILALILGLFIFIAIITSIASTTTTTQVTQVDANSILHIKLNKPIVDRVSPNPFDFINTGELDMNPAIGLEELLTNIKKAKTDKNIVGIYLDMEMFECGLATLQEIRSALIDFKQNKKFIICHSDLFTQKAYFLASVADKIYLTPEGYLDLRGLAATSIFFKDALDKLEIKPVVFKGKDNRYKSAVEPFITNKLSDENKEQTQLLLNQIWDVYTKDVASSRAISTNDINIIADSLKIRSAEDAVKLKLIDKLYYKDQVLSELQKLTKAKDSKSLKLVSLQKYATAPDITRKNIDRKTKIAVIYATGEITTGKSQKNSMGAETIAKALEDARIDSSVKAIVLRINSPGGGVGASEIIYREVLLARNSKPVVVSMGDVAASGGYWIASCANMIIANPNTITGSIGVFGMTVNIQDFFKNKLGITFDRVTTNKYSDMQNPTRTLSPFEVNAIQEGVNRIYDKFVNNVAHNRKLKPTYVDSIAKGRIWTGFQAQKIGLVDEIGDLNYAIKTAAKLANVKNYRVTQLPEIENPFQQFLSSLTGDKEEIVLKNKLGNNYIIYQQFQRLSQMKGIQARMPMELIIE